MGYSGLDGFPSLDILQRALDSALNKLSVASRPWRLVNGPAAVYAMVLARLGWRADSARSVTVHTGVTIDLFSISPGAVSALANEATRRWSDVKATSPPAPGAPGFVIFWDALRPLLLGKLTKDWSTRHRNALVFLLSGGAPS